MSGGAPSSFEAILRIAPQDEGDFDGVSVEILILRRREAASKDEDFAPGAGVDGRAKMGGLP